MVRIRFFCNYGIAGIIDKNESFKTIVENLHLGWFWEDVGSKLDFWTKNFIEAPFSDYFPPIFETPISFEISFSLLLYLSGTSSSGSIKVQRGMEKYPQGLHLIFLARR